MTAGLGHSVPQLDLQDLGLPPSRWEELNVLELFVH